MVYSARSSCVFATVVLPSVLDALSLFRWGFAPRERETSAVSLDDKLCFPVSIRAIFASLASSSFCSPSFRFPQLCFFELEQLEPTHSHTPSKTPPTLSRPSPRPLCPSRNRHQVRHRLPHQQRHRERCKLSQHLFEPLRPSVVSTGARGTRCCRD
jgi:hypothetical protein